MLSFILEELQSLQAAARERPVETCAVGFVAPAGRRNGVNRFVVRGLQEVPEGAYQWRTEVNAVLAPAYCMEVANEARANGMGVLFAHTHPGTNPLEGFSCTDDQGEVALACYFDRRLPLSTHFGAVITSRGISARQLGMLQEVPVTAAGRDFVRDARASSSLVEQYDRQVRALGPEGQRMLQGVKVAIVGLGGTGSVVAQQLAYLGVRDYVLIDPDSVEPTNLNRLVGATHNDIGLGKADMAARLISSVNPAATCTAIAGDVVNEDVAVRLLEVDFIFACTDSMASRAVMNQFAYQYLIPCIDTGVAIGVADGHVKYVSGRTQMLASGLPCLVCTDLLDGEQVRVEMLSEEQRRRDPYILGGSIPQPAVISINSSMSSAAVTMFLSAVAGLPSAARMVIYDGIRGSMRPTVMDQRPQCIVCSREGALARGSTWLLPTRHEACNG